MTTKIIELVIDIVAFFLCAFVVWLLWEPLLVEMFGVPQLSYWKIIGLMFLFSSFISPTFTGIAHNLRKIRENITGYSDD